MSEESNESGQSTSEWSCYVCTMINPVSSKICTICLTPKNHSISPSLSNSLPPPSPSKEPLNLSLELLKTIPDSRFPKKLSEFNYFINENLKLCNLDDFKKGFQWVLE